MTTEHETLELLPAPLDLLPAPAPPPRVTTIICDTLSRLEVDGEVLLESDRQVPMPRAYGTLVRIEHGDEVIYQFFNACPIGTIDDCMRHRLAEWESHPLMQAIETQVLTREQVVAAITVEDLPAAP